MVDVRRKRLARLVIMPEVLVRNEPVEPSRAENDGD